MKVWAHELVDENKIKKKLLRLSVHFQKYASHLRVHAQAWWC